LLLVQAVPQPQSPNDIKVRSDTCHYVPIER
jgi:hypothetical protein